MPASVREAAKAELLAQLRLVYQPEKFSMWPPWTDLATILPSWAWYLVGAVLLPPIWLLELRVLLWLFR